MFGNGKKKMVDTGVLRRCYLIYTLKGIIYNSNIHAMHGIIIYEEKRNYVFPLTKEKENKPK